MKYWGIGYCRGNVYSGANRKQVGRLKTKGRLSGRCQESIAGSRVVQLHGCDGFVRVSAAASQVRPASADSTAVGGGGGIK